MWKINFIDMLYPIQIIDSKKYLEDIDKAYKLKHKNMPEHLFKYNWLGEGSDYNITNFINNQIYLNQPEKFNDVFDCRFWIDIKKLALDMEMKFYKRTLDTCQDVLLTKKITLRQYLRFLLKTKKNYKIYKKIMRKTIYEELGEMYSNFELLVQKTSVVSCFSETMDSILMWGHYANKHSGFVLEYNFKELSNDDIRARMIYPVIYQKEFFDSTNYFLQMKKNDDQSFNNLYLNLPALIKNDDWSYEKEWRLIIAGGIFPKGTLYNVPIPKSIYLGINIDDKNRDLLIKIAKSKNMKIYQMVMKKDRYGLEYVQIK